MFTRLLSVTLTAAVVVALGSCGSSDPPVVKVGDATISKAGFEHWVRAIGYSDYTYVVGGRAPLGLVSEPADYKACVAAARQIPHPPGTRPPLKAGQLLQRCRELHAAVKEQTLTYLIPGLWRSVEAKQLGSGVSDREVSKLLAEVSAEHHSPAAFARYLANQHWSIADERASLKRELLIGNYGAKIRKRAKELGGGEQTIAQLVQQSFARWAARTDCSPGYTALQCRQRHGYPNTSAPSAAQVLEQMSGKGS